MRSEQVVVIGAGVGGLVAALELANRGLAVTMLEQAAGPGGKLLAQRIGDAWLDVGPTVFTMRPVFEEIFAAAGTTLDAHLSLRPVEILARHAWSERERLDLYADLDRSAAAIAEFAGPAAGRGYRAFCARAERIFTTLEEPFVRASRPHNPLALAIRVAQRGLGDLRAIEPFANLWQALGEHFPDPRLRQLFGRYATYVGASPFLAPATLMLIAHVERTGVWLVEGGMHCLADALAELAIARGVAFRYGARAQRVLVRGGRVAEVQLASGERIAAAAVVVNADVAAVARGRLGEAIAGAVPARPASARSLSAVTWALVAATEGFPLVRHNVFFSKDYAAEFEDLLGRAILPAAPTVYVCAQDRGGVEGASPAGPERLLCLVNASATGDRHPFPPADIARCEHQTFATLGRCGLHVDRHPETTVVTTPADFERRFPATGGALYGTASHGWLASFRRPGARTRLPGLYLAGGSTHPGAGVPMAALSGRLAAASLLEDLASTSRSRRTAMPGGTSTP